MIRKEDVIQSGSPEAELFPLDSYAFSLLDFIIQIDDQVADESPFRLGSEVLFLDLQDLSELFPCQPADSL